MINFAKTTILYVLNSIEYRISLLIITLGLLFTIVQYADAEYSFMVFSSLTNKTLIVAILLPCFIFITYKTLNYINHNANLLLKLNNRISLIKQQVSDNLGDYEKEKLLERLAKLSGGVAVIKVGAPTEVEMMEKKLRIEDAIAATKAASLEGFVPGGGVALLKTKKSLIKFIKNLKGDEKTGAEIILKAIEEPVKQIAENAGICGDIVVDKIIKSSNLNFGFDAYENKYGDMIKFGIIDPTKVTRSALQNAASVASTLLTTECLISNDQEK